MENSSHPSCLGVYLPNITFGLDDNTALHNLISNQNCLLFRELIFASQLVSPIT